MTTTPLAERETAVYRLFDVNKALLYVGISWDPDLRMKDHKTNSPWWPSVDHTTIAWYRNREAAMGHEAWAITAEAPLYNTRRPDPNRYSASDLEDEIVKLPSLNLCEASSLLRNPDAVNALSQGQLHAILRAITTELQKRSTRLAA